MKILSTQFFLLSILVLSFLATLVCTILFTKNSFSVLKKGYGFLYNMPLSDWWFGMSYLSLCFIGVIACSPKGTTELCTFFVLFALLSAILADEYMHEELVSGYKETKERKKEKRRELRNRRRELRLQERIRNNETMQMAHDPDQL